MISKRLVELGNMIPDCNRLIDVGCDHGLLDIYLCNILKKTKFLATDISSNALDNAKKNISANNLENRIETKLTDGLNDVELSKDDFIVISGMGTNTIIKILKPYLDSINNIIIQSNRDLESLRAFMLKNGFGIKEEKIVYDERYYTFIHFLKMKAKYDDIDIWLGPVIRNSNNCDYFMYLKSKYQKISLNIPENDPRKNEILSRLKFLEKLTEKK